MLSGAISLCLALQLPLGAPNRQPTLRPHWTFGIWMSASEDSQFSPPTSPGSLVLKNRGNTVTDIFRKGMHMQIIPLKMSLCVTLP